MTTSAVFLNINISNSAIFNWVGEVNDFNIFWIAPATIFNVATDAVFLNQNITKF